METKDFKKVRETTGRIKMFLIAVIVLLMFLCSYRFGKIAAYTDALTLQEELNQKLMEADDKLEIANSYLRNSKEIYAAANAYRLGMEKAICGKHDLD
ncbi:MAG: hypothetical protein RBT33_00715 [Candidatus Dojkabacteria bacterium]|jgi:hypothetical protein|nr:hypothetical protein [Candidatus Dojkabacteria bacterium]